jgi:hypothetical protein
VPDYLAASSSGSAGGATPNDRAALAACEETLRKARRLWRCMMSNSEYCEYDNDDNNDAQSSGSAIGGGSSATSTRSGRVLKWTFDAVLKYMALHRDASYRWIEERFDCVLVDEAQDTQQVLLGWYRGFWRLPVYFVGDMHQAIYGFTGCRNAMEQFVQLDDTRVFHLTQSFRFGQNLARLATLLLRSAGMLGGGGDDADVAGGSGGGGGAVRGRKDMHCTILAAYSNELALQKYVSAQLVRPTSSGGSRGTDGGNGSARVAITYISRSNAVALDRAFEARHYGRRVRILGCLHQQVVDAGKLAQTRFRRILPGGALMTTTLSKRPKMATNSGISGASGGGRGGGDSDEEEEDNDDEDDDGGEPLMFALRELEKRVIAARKSKTRLVSDHEKSELAAMQIIKKFGSAPTLFLAQTLAESDDEADVIVGTAHSTKGLEFDIVVLADDFYPLSIMRRFFAKIGDAAIVRRDGSGGGTQAVGVGGSGGEERRRVLSRADEKHYLRLAEADEMSLEAVRVARRLIPSMAEPSDAIIGHNNNNNDHSLSTVQKMREEIHLYYVAMTRARHALILNQSLNDFYGRKVVEPMPTMMPTAMPTAVIDSAKPVPASTTTASHDDNEE